MRRLVRVTVPPTKYGWDDDHVSFALVTKTGEPDNYREAIEADDHDKWITIMEQDLESLDRNQIWTLVDRSSKGVQGNRLQIGVLQEGQ